MIKVVFKNVGQGDSILLEWQSDGFTHFGLLDCNTFNDTNPLLQEIINRKVKHLDFIILSHLHHDHYSGLPDLLQYCIDNDIKIGLFLHTFTNDFTRILNIIVRSKKVETDTTRLLDNIKIARKKKIIIDHDGVTHNFRPIHLYDDVYLKFLAPTGDDSLSLSNQRSSYEKKASSTIPNVNIMSTIVEISNKDECILLVSDATRQTFKRIRHVVKKKLLMTQVPHHGSQYNLFNNFWELLKKDEGCPAVYSVGDVPKDKLPNKSVVEFFESQHFNNMSTNLVYGLAEHYGSSSMTAKALATIRSFSPLLKAKPTIIGSSAVSPRFFGDKSFQFNL